MPGAAVMLKGNFAVLLKSLTKKHLDVFNDSDAPGLKVIREGGAGEDAGGEEDLQCLRNVVYGVFGNMEDKFFSHPVSFSFFVGC